jgi:hypothetical protein
LSDFVIWKRITLSLEKKIVSLFGDKSPKIKTLPKRMWVLGALGD